MIMLDPEPQPSRIWSGRGLRQFIGKHGISVADLAIRAGLRPSTVLRIMNSQIEPSLSTAILIHRERVEQTARRLVDLCSQRVGVDSQALRSVFDPDGVGSSVASPRRPFRTLQPTGTAGTR